MMPNTTLDTNDDQTIVDFEKEKKSGKPKRNCTDRKL